MQVVREDLNPCTVKLTVTCTEAQIKDGFNKAFKIAAKQIRVPGFRPGHAPRHLIEPQVSKDALKETAAEEIVKATWPKAAEQEGLAPFMTPGVEVGKIEEDPAECEYVIRIPLKPVVELGDYKSLQAQRPGFEVSDEEVENEIEIMRRRRGKREAITSRGVEAGDSVVLNIKVEGEEGDGRTFLSVAGKTFDALDKVIIGMQAEEMKSAKLTFPDNFQEKDWCGKKHNCQVTVRSLSTIQVPQLDDEFAQSLQLDNVDELRNRLKELILQAKQEQVNQYVSEQILDDLVNKSTIHVPDSMWEQVAHQRLTDIAREQAQQNKSLEAYAKEHGMEVEAFIEAVKSEAKMYVLRAQAIQTIFEKEEMKIDNNDLNIELARMAAEYETDPKTLFESLKKNNAVAEIHHRSIHRKVLEYLHSHAVIADVK